MPNKIQETLDTRFCPAFE